MVSHNVRLPNVILDQEDSPYHGNISVAVRLVSFFLLVRRHVPPCSP